jgi:hypothetical protein
MHPHLPNAVELRALKEGSHHLADALEAAGRFLL